MTSTFQSEKTKTRIESLDWLRGLTALSILSYHLSFWYFFKPDAGSFIGRIGIYGVSIFFILSGLSMAIVYNRFVNSVKRCFAFYARRIFRIWPLLIVATIATIGLSNTLTPSLSKIVLNITGFFGFVPPFEYIATGAWSIGNEMFYYALTPFFLWLFNQKKWIGNLSVIVCISISLYFAFVLMNHESTLANQWNIYIHPLNNLSFYTIGIAIFYNFKDSPFNQNFNTVLLLASLLALIIYPINGNQIEIVTGYNRLIFMTLSVGLVMGFYKTTISVTRSIALPLEKLGLFTYGVYILHPVVRLVVLKTGLTDRIGISVSIFALTLLLSALSYHYIELPLMKAGKKLTSKL